MGWNVGDRNPRAPAKIGCPAGTLRPVAPAGVGPGLTITLGNTRMTPESHEWDDEWPPHQGHSRSGRYGTAGIDGAGAAGSRAAESLGEASVSQVVVVGGGMAGVACAMELGDKGIEVLLIDRND